MPAASGRSRSRAVLLVVLSVLCVVGAGLVGLLAYFRSGSPEGAALVLIFALLPLPFVVGFFLFADRYEPEPTRYVIAAFTWGAVGSVALVLGIQLLLLRVLDVKVSESILATVWAPGFEESAKALFLVALVVFRRQHLGGVLDGIVYAGIAGAGFAFTENVLYYAGAYSGSLAEDNPDVEEFDGAGATTLLFVVRGLFSPFAHSLFCVAFGIAVGLAVSTRLRWVRWVAPPLGLLASMGLHAAWNGSVTFGGPGSFLLAAAGRRRPGRRDAYARGADAGASTARRRRTRLAAPRRDRVAVSLRAATPRSLIRAARRRPVGQAGRCDLSGARHPVGIRS
jgi:RsiW-degrading membrane proteinase PrsW (M82 family)